MHPRHSQRTVLLLLGIVVASLVLPIVAGPAAAAEHIRLAEIDIPNAATPGDEVQVSAWAHGDEALDNTIQLTIFRMDTGEKLCEQDGTLPGTIMCGESFTMPDDDVEIRILLAFSTGAVIDEHRTTITADPTDNTDDTSDDSTTDDETDVIDIGGGSIEDPDDTADTSDGTDTDDTADEEDDGGLVNTVIDGLTDGAKTDWLSVITDALVGVLFEPFQSLATTLIDSLALLLTWTPDVHPNPAVEEVHQQTLLVAIMLAFIGVLAAGILHQVGPVLGISYQQVRLILPRLLIALLFATISLPVLQLVIDLSNTLVLAFQPAAYQHSLMTLGGLSAGLLLVWVIQATALLAVIVVYLIANIYILFVAAISPLIAIAWALPRTRRYAQSMISGWWVAVAMGPMAMLVLQFVFALLNTDASNAGGQAVTNWLFGLAAFVLLLVFPVQLYGAASRFTGAGFQAATTVGNRLRRRTPWAETTDHRPRRRTRQSTHAPPDVQRPTTDGGTSTPRPNPYAAQIMDQPWNHPRERESWDMEQRAPSYRPPRRTDPADSTGKFDDVWKDDRSDRSNGGER